MASRKEIINILQKSDAVCFDVDSTICTGEGIDELAIFCGKGELVKEMYGILATVAKTGNTFISFHFRTSKAMSGNMDFREALNARLNVIQPNRSQIKKMLTERPLQLTNGIQELFKVLRSNHKQLYMVSGGFDCLIHPLARQLGLPVENVFANKLKFYYDGQYAGFDEDQFTSYSGGKRHVIGYLKKHFNHSVVVMIGDGITDLETYPTADAFIGFGGNVVREAVKEQSHWFITNFNEIIDVL